MHINLRFKRAGWIWSALRASGGAVLTSPEPMFRISECVCFLLDSDAGLISVPRNSSSMTSCWQIQVFDRCLFAHVTLVVKLLFTSSPNCSTLIWGTETDDKQKVCNWILRFLLFFVWQDLKATRLHDLIMNTWNLLVHKHYVITRYLQRVNIIILHYTRNITDLDYFILFIYIL